MGKTRKKRPEWTCIAEREFDGDIVITDPCYVKEEGKRIDWGSHMAWMELHGLCSETYYGDWGCSVFKASEPVGREYEKSDWIGEFCADAGMVCVLDMRDAREISPDIDKWIAEHGWCVTIVKNFKGTVRFMTTKEKGWFTDKKGRRFVYHVVELRVRGEGTKDGQPFSFESYQTSL